MNRWSCHIWRPISRSTSPAPLQRQVGAGERRGVVVLGAAEVLPGVRDRRQPGLEPLRQHEIAVDDLQIVGERGDPVRERVVAALAELLRTELRHRLVGIHRVAAAEQREDVVRVVLRDREQARLRVLAGQDGRNGVGGVLVNRVRVPVPGRRRGERREVREAPGVDQVIRPEQGRLGELVENHEDDRHRVLRRRDRQRPRARRELTERDADEEDHDEQDAARARARSGTSAGRAAAC